MLQQCEIYVAGMHHEHTYSYQCLVCRKDPISDPVASQLKSA